MSSSMAMRGAEVGDLFGIERILPPAKAALALRSVFAGRAPVPPDFDRKGFTLSEGETAALNAWLATGMRTRVHAEAKAADGTLRLTLALGDGELVETVAMPAGAVCVSSQVGCAVGCRFCASGLYGVRRHLDAGEMCEQVVHARRRMALDRVVFMGMGEPSHNLDEVLEAVGRIHDRGRIGPRRQTVSTVGSSSAFERMSRAPVRPCLALSLHTVHDRLRRELMPRAPREAVRDLITGADAYGRTMGMPVQFEWTLLAGVNDSLEEADELAGLLRGIRGYVNYIVWNPVEGLPFRAPSRKRVVELVRRVKAAGVLATIRDSSGPDAEAACGQLRLRSRPAG